MGIAVVSLISESAANRIVSGWYKILEGLGFINSRIILLTVYFFVLTPMAFLSRLQKRDSLKLKKSANSYFTTRNHAYTKKDLEKMW